MRRGELRATYITGRAERREEWRGDGMRKKEK
jgi:hypothetical protein